MSESALPPPRSAVPSLAAPVRMAVLPCLLLAAVLLATMVGYAHIAPGETMRILLYKLGVYPGRATWSPLDQQIIWSLRLPRVVAAALVGAALGVAGALFQAVLRNPLADPYVIGTSAGAQLGVAAAILLPTPLIVAGLGLLQVLAFLGAVLTVLFVYSLARTGGRTPVVTLLLAGFVVSSFLISGTTFLMISNNEMSQILTWTMGGLEVSAWSQLGATGPLIILAIVAANLLAPRLDVILLGEEQAGHLGVQVERFKLVAIILASLLTALAVVLAGIVAFVGLVVPHAVRLTYGPGHRLLLPMAAIAGAVFVVIADLLAHVILAPTVLPLGVITVVVGAPFFLHLLRRARRDYGL